MSCVLVSSFQPSTKPNLASQWNNWVLMYTWVLIQLILIYEIKRITDHLMYTEALVQLIPIHEIKRITNFFM